MSGLYQDHGEKFLMQLVHKPHFEEHCTKGKNLLSLILETWNSIPNAEHNFRPPVGRNMGEQFIFRSGTILLNRHFPKGDY